jgi:hypothetical protein
VKGSDVVTNLPDLKELEQRNYKATHSDGVIDVFVGISMVVIGVTWIVIPNVLSVVTAGVAISISPMLAWRRRFIEDRTGYVMFTEPRRLWERRIYTTAAVLFSGFMLLARPLGSLQPEDIDWMVGPDSSVVWLVAAVLLLLGVQTKLTRLLVYSLVLTAAGTVPFVISTESFGWPLLISGAVIVAVGSALIGRFVIRHPRIGTL